MSRDPTQATLWRQEAGQAEDGVQAEERASAKALAGHELGVFKVQ